MAGTLSTSTTRLWNRLGSRPNLARRLALILTVAATLSGLATFLVMKDWVSLDSNPELVLGLLWLNVILLLSLGLIGKFIWKQFQPSVIAEKDDAVIS
jgi:hypothetical protein